MNCDWCGLPFTEGEKAIGYDYGVYHLPCARDSESGKVSPLAQQDAAASGGLWAFTSGFNLHDFQRQFHDAEGEALIRPGTRDEALAAARRLLKAAEAQLEWDPAEQTDELRDAVKGLRDALGTDGRVEG